MRSDVHRVHERGRGPERVKPRELKAGQWWAFATSEEAEGHVSYSRVVRLTDDDFHGMQIVPRGDVPICLGDGEHPDPSPWMIETLARHGMDVEYGIGTWDREPEIGNGFDIIGRREYRRGVRALLCTGSVHVFDGYGERAVLSLRDILRSLGYA